MAKERLQKVLAQAGVASRRGAEQLIDAGRVRVNGRVVREQGLTVDFRDVVELDGRRVVAEKPVYFLLHKPRKVVTTLDDPEGRETVAHLLKGVTERVFPVGRLDYHTSGALLLTNDGALADSLLRPKSAVPKVYVAKVPGDVGDDALTALTEGVTLDDGRRTRPAEVVVLRYDAGHSWLRLTLTEGRNRQVHRMLEAVGKEVHRLARLSFADLTTDGLRPGQFRALKVKELERIQKRWGSGQQEAALGGRAARYEIDPEADVAEVNVPRGRAAGRAGGRGAPKRGAKPSEGTRREKPATTRGRKTSASDERSERTTGGRGKSAAKRGAKSTRRADAGADASRPARGAKSASKAGGKAGKPAAKRAGGAGKSAGSSAGRPAKTRSGAKKTSAPKKPRSRS